MYYHKITCRILAFSALVLLNASCTQSLLGGSLQSSFNGISTATVLGPQTVELNWITSRQCSIYKVYNFASSNNGNNTPLAVTSIPPVRLKTPTIQSDSAYTFSIGCVQNDKTVGTDVTRSVNTWTKFDGNLSITQDQYSTQTIKLAWNYLANSGATFKIYATPSSIPGDLANWLLPTNAGGEPSDSPVCVTTNNSLSIGPGPNDCHANLETGIIYNFKVVANYLDQTYSTDYQGAGASFLIPSTFDASQYCTLSESGLGPNPTQSYLYLRCNTSGGTSCSSGNITVQAFQAVNGSRAAISELLVASTGALLRVEPRLDSSLANDRALNALEVEYTCILPSKNLKSIVRYDGVGSNPKKPTLKYSNSYADRASGQAAGISPGYFGSGPMSVGDYNCDGKPDLAVGMPNVSYSAAPYFSQYPGTGLVKVYYDYTGSYSNNSNVQYLSFRDLGKYANFGFSLSSGNINKDVSVSSVQTGQLLYSCDDLIVGAPGMNSAFIFYGNPQRFQQPLDYYTVPSNTSTCSGSYEASSCSVVRLKPNDRNTIGTNFDTGEVTLPGHLTSGTSVQFGYSVSYVRDFNADGYGDVAVGAPHSDWDGYSSGGNAVVTYPDGKTGLSALIDVGSVYVFFGGATGITPQNVGHTAINNPATSNDTLTTPYIKVFSPFPQAASLFGASISGGGDIDGKLPVPVSVDTDGHIILAEGNDFIVGAPNFSYTNTSAMGVAQTPNWNISAYSAADEVDPIVGRKAVTGNIGGVSTATHAASNAYTTDKFTPPLNGGWAQTAWTAGSPMPTPSNPSLRSSRGIAFAYLGRSPWKAYQVKVTPNSNYPKRPVGMIFGDTTTPFQFFTLINKAQQAFQSASKYMTLNSGSIDYLLSPRDSFYNCGPRGNQLSTTNPTATYSNGNVTHNSCLAGRNNFRVIYPEVKSGDGAVTGFGTNLGIAGSDEVNHIALFFSSRENTAYQANDYVTPSSMLAYKQGDTHFRVRGQNEWEAGLSGINSTGAVSSSQNCSDYGSNCEISSGVSNGPYNLGRSAIQETYQSWAADSATLTTAPASLTKDINRDGYADVVVSSSSDLWTYYGNYAADFSYSDASGNYSTFANCLVNRATINPLASGLPAATPPATQFEPFSTYTVKYATAKQYAAPNTAFNFISAEIPYYPPPGASSTMGLRYLGDGETDAASIMTYISPNRTSVASVANSCIPQRKSAAGVASISIADINNDGVSDVVTGYPGFSSNQGQGVATLAAGSGFMGLTSDMNFSDGTTSSSNGNSASQGGRSVLGSSWKTMTLVQTGPSTSQIVEDERRDLLIGAPGQRYADIPAAGMIHHFSASSNGAMFTTRAPASENTFYADTNNAPYSLAVEKSKIIGDLNGDGYDDIISPLKRYDTNGNAYFDVVIFFGSPVGAITTTFCLNKLNQSYLKDVDGHVLNSASLCEAAGVSALAYIDGNQIHLPQLVQRSSAVSTAWALSTYSAGDVNADGKDDVVIIDSTGMSVFFGSDFGIVAGDPAWGEPSNLAPQRVLGVSGIGAQIVPSGSLQPDSAAIPNPLAASSPFPYSDRVVHGDFNKDGYEDIAFTVNTASPNPARNNSGTLVAVPWNCGTTNLNNNNVTYCAQAYTGTPMIPAPEVAAHGSVVVIYGGSNGYKTPGSDIPSPSGLCSNFYGKCNDSTGGKLKLAYGSLSIASGGVSASIDNTKTACDPTNGCTAATLIRNPMFFNRPGAYGLLNNGFGQAITVADVNGDGVDDLVVSAPSFSHSYLLSDNNTCNTDAGTSGCDAEAPLGAPTGTGDVSELITGTTDSSSKGSVFIYYGSKSYGIVAPAAQNYFGNQSLGFKSDSANIAFRIYPRHDSSTTGAPSLDILSGVYQESSRMFGTSMTVGDFDGDKKDDLVVSSVRGHVYVYYGAICATDNGGGVNSNSVNADFSALQNASFGMYSHHNMAVPLQGNTSSTPQTYYQYCKALDLSSVNNLGSAASIKTKTKPFAPQLIRVAGAVAGAGMGTTLISKRYNPLTLKQKGDMNGSEKRTGTSKPEYTSDLIIGGPYITDPSIDTTRFTGTGYVFFGSPEGIFVGTPNYNSSIVAGSNTPNVGDYHSLFYSSPLTLKPYPSDGSITGFFYTNPSAGDVNGDGRMDLMMPTLDVDSTNDSTRNALDAGGFVLFY